MWPGARQGWLFFDWTDACVAHPFLDLATIRRGTAFADGEGDELRELLRAVYRSEWASFEPPERLDRGPPAGGPLGALHQAVSYRSIVAQLEPPIDAHMRKSTAWWLRRMLTELDDLKLVSPGLTQAAAAHPLARPALYRDRRHRGLSRGTAESPPPPQTDARRYR